MISNVITTYNRKEVLVQHLDALKNQTHKDFEVIVVSDGSSDGTISELERYRAPYPLTFVQIPKEGYRLAYARNVGIKLTRGEKIVITDDDLIPDEGYLQVFADHVRVGTMVLGHTQHAEKLLDKNNVWRNSNGNVGFDAEDWTLYDENFTSYGLEDLDFGIECHLWGARFEYHPEAKVYEDNRPYNIDPLTQQQKNQSLLANLGYLQSKYENLDELLGGWSFYEWMKRNTTRTSG